jgi:hypothetical protein
LSPVIERQLGRTLHELQACRLLLFRALGRKGRDA